MTSEILEKLVLLNEECIEAAQECLKAAKTVDKILRNGFDNHHPKTPEITNKTQLERELGHIEAAISLLVKKGVLDWRTIEDSRLEKLATVHNHLKCEA
jgi:hypothetical protein